MMNNKVQVNKDQVNKDQVNTVTPIITNNGTSNAETKDSSSSTKKGWNILRTLKRSKTTEPTENSTPALQGSQSDTDLHQKVTVETTSVANTQNHTSNEKDSSNQPTGRTGLGAVFHTLNVVHHIKKKMAKRNLNEALHNNSDTSSSHSDQPLVEESKILLNNNANNVASSEEGLGKADENKHQNNELVINFDEPQRGQKLNIETQLENEVRLRHAALPETTTEEKSNDIVSLPDENPLTRTRKEPSETHQEARVEDEGVQEEPPSKQPLSANLKEDTEVSSSLALKVLNTIFSNETLQNRNTLIAAAALFVIGVGVLVALTYGAAACPTIALWLAPLGLKALLAIQVVVGTVTGIAAVTLIGASTSSCTFFNKSNNQPAKSSDNTLNSTTIGEPL